MRAEIEFTGRRTNASRAKWLRGDRVEASGQMTRFRLAIFVLAAMLCATGMAHAQNKKNKQKGPVTDAAPSTSSILPDNQAVDLLVSQMLGAWQARDAEGMHKFYADDVMVISGAWEAPLVGWVNYSRAYQAQIARTSSCRLERSNSYTKIMGDTAVVTYQWQFWGNVDGKNTQAFGHTTLLLEKRAGNWLITLNHTSAIPTDDPSVGTPSNSTPTSSLAPAAH